MAESEALSIEPFHIREQFGPRSLYRYEPYELATAYPELVRHDDGGLELTSRLVCRTSSALDVGGRGRTESSGNVVWRLSEHVCDFEGVVSEPVSFVATPTTERSRFPIPFDLPRCALLTVEYDIEAGGGDLIVVVSSWSGDCEPVGGVPFSYRALVQVRRRIVVD